MDTLLASVNSLKESLTEIFNGTKNVNSDLISAFETKLDALEGSVQTELSAAKSSIEASSKEIESLKAQLAASESKVGTLTAAQADFDAKLKNGIAVGVMEAAASAGIPPLPVPKEQSPVDPKAKTSGLTGLAKVEAAFRAESEKRN